MSDDVHEAKVGIVVGLASEANALLSSGLIDKQSVEIAGANPDRAENAARALIRGGCDALISLGLCGGLDPALRPGDVVVAGSIVDPAGTRFASPGPWRQSAVALIGSGEGHTLEATIAGADAAVSTVAEKAALAAETGAAVVDMESHRVARAAAASNVPMLAVRVVADPAERHIPSWVSGAIDAHGDVKVSYVIGNLMIRPWQLAGLLQLASDSETALKRLGGVARLAGPGFGLLL